MRYLELRGVSHQWSELPPKKLNKSKSNWKQGNRKKNKDRNQWYEKRTK